MALYATAIESNNKIRGVIDISQYQGKPPRPPNPDDQYVLDDPYNPRYTGQLIQPIPCQHQYNGQLPLAVPWQQQNNGQHTQLISTPIQYYHCQPSLKVPWVPPTLPVDLMPGQLSKVVRDLKKLTQVSECLIGASMLSLMAYCVQDSHDVSPIAQLRYPLTLYQIVIAVTGERKSGVDKLLMKGVRNLEKKYERIYHEEIKKYNKEMRFWRLDQKGLEKEYTQARSRGKPTEAIVQRLDESTEREPVKPVLKRIFMNDVSIAALKKELGLGWHSLLLHSDDAGSFLESDLFHDTSLLNDLWSNQPIEVDRANSEGYRIEDVRVTIFLMVQPGIYTNSVDRKNKNARLSGFSARVLISKPPSTIGNRLHIDSVQESDTSSALDWFHSRSEALLEQSFQRRENKLDRICQTLSPEASEMWKAEYNRIELMCGPGGELREFQDYASKQLEHATRIAGVLEAFVTGNAIISGETMYAAIQIARYYLGSFITLMSEDSEHKEQEDELALEQWLRDKLWRSDNGLFERNFIRKHCPHRLRDTKYLDQLLENLRLKGKVMFHNQGRKAYVGYIYQHPQQNQINYGF